MATHNPVVLCRRLRKNAVLPVYQTAGAAGMDLCACLAADLEAAQDGSGSAIVLAPLMRVLVPTGLAVAIPEGYEGQIRPRSGWALKHGITVLNAPGTIDCDYRGEIQILLINLGQASVTINSGDRIAQLVIAPVTCAQICEVEVLDDTARGTGGFGHTGRGQPKGE